MKIILTAIRSGLVIFSLFFSSVNSLAGSFVKTQELTGIFKHGILEISTSEKGDYVFIEEGSKNYWLMSTVRPFMPYKIFDDKLNSLPYEKKPVHAQWHNQHIMFFYRDRIEFYNVQNKKIEHRYMLDISGYENEIIWSEKHRSFIAGTKVFPIDRTTEGHLGQDRHAAQTGLVMMNNGDDYITSGYHDQRIMRWTLPNGELKKAWQIGSWYSSRKVSDIALIDNRLLVASNNGLIEERSLEEGTVLWSATPCSGFFNSTPPAFLLNGGARFKKRSISHNRLVFYDCSDSDSDPEYGYIEKQGNEWVLNKIILPSTGNTGLGRVYYLETLEKAIFGLDDGQVLLYDLKSKRIDQEIVPKVAGGEGLAMLAYLKADKLLVIVKNGGVDIYQYQ